MKLVDMLAPIPSPPLIPAQGNGRRLLARLPEILGQVETIIQDNVGSGSHTSGAVAAFEAVFAHLLRAEAVSMNSGSSALRAACELLQLPSGSEVILPGYTFVMTAYAISDSFAVQPDGTLGKGGLIPVFVDVDPHTYTLNPHRVEQALTEKTRAILAVHMLGQMADMRSLLDIAEKYGLYVIEDAAQAIGATYRDPLTGALWHAGSAGHLGCFSLSSVKNIGSMGGDAGLLTLTPRLLDLMPDMTSRARAWRNTGRATAHRYLHQMWGTRARMDEYSAAECLAELPLLEAWNSRRRVIAQQYTAELNGAFQAPYVAPGREHTYFSYMIKAPDLEARAHLMRRMREAGVTIGDSYTVIADQGLYQQGMLPCRVTSLEVSRMLAQLLVPIPCYPELLNEEIERIVGVLHAL